FTLSSSSVTFNASQGPAELFAYRGQRAVPYPEVVNVATTSGNVFIKTLQTGTMFGHSFTADSSTTGHVTIEPAYPSEVGSFTGTITVNACSNATGPCNHVAGSPKTINVAYNVLGLTVTPRQLTFSSTDITHAWQTVTLAITGGSPFWIWSSASIWSTI